MPSSCNMVWRAMLSCLSGQLNVCPHIAVEKRCLCVMSLIFAFFLLLLPPDPHLWCRIHPTTSVHGVSLSHHHHHLGTLLESAKLATSHTVPWSKRALKRTYTVCSSCSWGWFWDDQLCDTGKICWNCGAVIEQKSEQKTQQQAQKTSNMVNLLKRMVSSPDTIPLSANHNFPLKL